MGILPAANTTANNQSSSSSTNAVNDIDMNTFLKLMITELQQQDPLNPMDNKDMLNQIAQIRAVGASDQLTKTLSSVLLGQNITSATNLMGADISAITDSGESITGIVNRVAIDKGVPKIHVENAPGLAASAAEGKVEAGTYNYRVVWSGPNNTLLGMDFSGNNGITTTGAEGVDQSIHIQGLPATDGPKYVYRTDKTGTGNYQLVGVIAKEQGSVIDDTADADRNGQTLTASFQQVSKEKRMYDVALGNVSVIRPPAY